MQKKYLVLIDLSNVNILVVDLGAFANRFV